METDHRRNYVTVWSIVSRGTHWNVCVNHHLWHANKNDIRSAPKGENTHRHSRRIGVDRAPQTLRSLFHCGLRRPTNPSARVNSIAKHTHTDARVAPQKSVYTHWGLYATKTEVYVTEWTERLPQSGTEGVNYRGTGSLLEVLGAIRTPPGASVDVHSQLNYA